MAFGKARSKKAMHLEFPEARGGMAYMQPVHVKPRNRCAAEMQLKYISAGACADQAFLNTTCQPLFKSLQITAKKIREKVEADQQFRHRMGLVSIGSALGVGSGIGTGIAIGSMAGGPLGLACGLTAAGSIVAGAAVAFSQKRQWPGTESEFVELVDEHITKFVRPALEKATMGNMFYFENDFDLDFERDDRQPPPDEFLDALAYIKRKVAQHMVADDWAVTLSRFGFHVDFIDEKINELPTDVAMAAMLDPIFDRLTLLGRRDRLNIAEFSQQLTRLVRQFGTQVHTRHAQFAMEPPFTAVEVIPDPEEPGGFLVSKIAIACTHLVRLKVSNWCCCLFSKHSSEIELKHASIVFEGENGGRDILRLCKDMGATQEEPQLCRTLAAHVRQMDPHAPQQEQYAPIGVWKLLSRPDLHAESNAFAWNTINGIQVAPIPQGSAWCQFVTDAFAETMDAHRIIRMELIHNPDLEASLYGKTVLLGRARDDPAFNPPLPALADFNAGLQKLRRIFVTPKHPSLHATVNLVLSWHAIAAGTAHTLARTGIRAMRITDAGFFGGEIYSTLEASYTERYCTPDPNTGEKAVLLLATVICLPWVITLENDYNGRLGMAYEGFSDFYSNNPGQAVALKPRCDTHFVPVKYYGMNWQGPTIVKPQVDVYPNKLMQVDLDYQACPEAEATAHEIVSHDSAQCYPLAVVYYR